MQSEHSRFLYYCHLSQESRLAGESASIQHQNRFNGYVQRHEFANPRIWIDDGYSCVSFERPAYNQMMAQVDAGNAAIIIVIDYFFYTDIQELTSEVVREFIDKMWCVNALISGKKLYARD